MGDKFANEGDVDRQGKGDLIQLGSDEDLACEFVSLEGKVLGKFPVDVLLGRQDRLHLARSGADRNDHAGLHEEGAAVYFFAVDLDVAVRDELLGAEDRRGEPEAKDDVVEAALELLNEQSRCVALNLESFFVGVDELFWLIMP